MVTEGSQIFARSNDATYELRRFLGGGRIALVYQAEQIWPPDQKGRQVAIKLARSAGENERMKAETALLEKVKDEPGFPRLEGWGETREDPPRSFLVMELIQGERLSMLAQRYPNFRLPEPLGIETALQYARVLQTLHKSGYASTDRKLDDIYWIKEESRLVVLDWNVAAKADEITQAADLYQFGLFWYELLLGSPPPRIQERIRLGVESHPHWHHLTYGTQYILARALDPTIGRRYKKAQELVEDLKFLASLFSSSADGLLNTARQEQEKDPRRAMFALDVVRVRFPDIWSQQGKRTAEGLIEKLRDHQDKCLEDGQKDLDDHNYDQGIEKFEEALNGTSLPEQQLRIQRWIHLARFAGGLPAEIRGIFHDHTLRPLIGVVKALEEGKFQDAADGFWKLLSSAFLPSSQSPPSGFKDNLRKAQEEYAQGRDPAPSLQEAYKHLKEAWPKQAELFARVVGLRHDALETPESREWGVRFLADEAMLRLRLWEAAERRQQCNLEEAIRLYGQALYFYEVLPSEAKDLLIRQQIEEPDEAKKVCEKLAQTLGEAEKYRSAGEDHLNEGNFRAAEKAFADGLALFSETTGVPEWAREWGEGLIEKLRRGRRRAQLRLALKEALELLQDEPNPTSSPLETGVKSRAPKKSSLQPPDQGVRQEEDLLEVALFRLRRLREEFPDDDWGNQQRDWLKRRLADRVEECLHSPEAGEARLTRIARLISLTRRDFGRELQKELQEWELRATLALQEELDQVLISAEEKLREGWRVNLGNVLDEWKRGHEMLRQLACFQDVFDLQALEAQEKKLDMLYEQVRNLAQLQRDMAAEVEKRRAQMDAEEQRRREMRRRAYLLVQEAGRVWEKKPEPLRSDLEEARSKVEEALRLWPECPDDGLLDGLKKRIEEFDQQFQNVWNQASEKLNQGQFQEALQALANMPPDVFLSSEQIARRTELRQQIIGEALSQARKQIAEGEYPAAEATLGEIAGAEMTSEQQQERQMLSDRLKRFRELAGALAQASQTLEDQVLNPLRSRPPAFEGLREHLESLIRRIEETPEELPAGLKEKIKAHLEAIEKALWDVRKRLRFWQTGPLAEVAANLSIVGWLQRQIEGKEEFSPGEEVPDESGTEVA